ncbi:MAG TPA: energy transducer TonB [Bacteroidales bacterium]|jgi:protein TonB|nr:energy transducer TonB [Bacteroidota bacterium]HJN06522.1 energy transducer TonB [Bacteroidales bacterium]|tara:strand:- start:653 stop:1318 length:666 start_codon:yes stop_codon:yes gene_type:complete
MRKRKNKKSELESKKLIFFQVGLVIALLSVLYAFEYKSYEKYEIPEFSNRDMEVDWEIIIPTKHKKKLPPPVPSITIEIDNSREIYDGPIDFDVAGDDKTPTDWYPELDPEPQIEDDLPTYFPAEKPSFPGGYKAMMSFLKKNIVYPKLANKINITGKVYIEFTVEKDGSVSDLIVLRGIGGGCEEEALRVVNMMPKWNCGKQNGIPVRVRLTLPIKFSLF